MTNEDEMTEQLHENQLDSAEPKTEWVDLPELESTKDFPGLFPWM